MCNNGNLKALSYGCALAALVLTSCTVGPDYKRPTSEKSPPFKEAQNWKQAEPKDAAQRTQWWEAFNDPDLNKLEVQIDITNQNVKAAEAQFRAARALIAEARAGFFPSISASASLARTATGSNGNAGTINGATGAASAFSGSINNEYNASLGASWEPDIWGRIRRTVEANVAGAQASAADLASARLSAQATLATDYLGLRVADEQKRLLDKTVEAYKRSLQITKNLYASGVDAQSDVMQAEVQLESASAQAIDIGVLRAQYEHAIAILIGKAPAEFSIEPVATVPQVPVIPVSLPSELLERRPDIAGNERRVAAANAQIGVTEAAFFPDITLSASEGFQSSSFSNLFSSSNRIWSIGPSVTETLFDAGLRSAQTEAAIATYDQTVATYRQTVLTAFQSVEDNLAALRILEQEAVIEQQAVKDAQKTTEIVINEYKAGTVSYLNVVTAQTTELSNELTAVNIEKQRLADATALITALGGGWAASELDKPYVTEPKTTVLSIFPPSFCPASECCGTAEECTPHSAAPAARTPAK